MDQAAEEAQEDEQARSEGGAQVTAAVRVIVVRMMSAPVVEFLEPDSRREGSHLAAMQKIVGGTVQCVGNFDHRDCDLWCNDEGRIIGLPLNRVIPAPPRGKPAGIFADAFVIKMDDDLAEPDEPGEWRIFGDFFIARTDGEGELADVTDDDIAYYTKLLNAVDTFTRAMSIVQATDAAKPDAIAGNRCIPPPVGCGGDASTFVDDVSRREYEITGMCQSCQDRFYGEDEGA